MGMEKFLHSWNATVKIVKLINTKLTEFKSERNKRKTWKTLKRRFEMEQTSCVHFTTLQWFGCVECHRDIVDLGSWKIEDNESSLHNNKMTEVFQWIFHDELFGIFVPFMHLRISGYPLLQNMMRYYIVDAVIKQCDAMATGKKKTKNLLLKVY